MLDTLNREVLLPLIARKRGSRHLQYLRFLERTQYDSPQMIRARQFCMLKAILEHAYQTVPYYRQTWNDAGLNPGHVQALDDLQTFPVVSKTELRTRHRDFLSTAYDVAKLRIKRTSGSTGVPLTIRIDEPGLQWKYACTLRADQWSGYRLGQRVAKVWGNPEYRHHGWRGRISNWLVDRAIYLDTIGLTVERIREFAKVLRRHQPGLLFGHAHSLYLLACQLKKAGITDIRPRGIIATAMPLYDWQRKLIQEVFEVAPTNRYGCEEVSLIASECEQHHGLHITSESILTEVESSGHLLVTDLSNFAMPLIRYRVGDVVVPSTRLCRCGRGLPLLERVEGRDADFVVTPRGELISGISLTENFALHLPGAAQVQIIQEELTRLRIRLVAEESFATASREKLAELVRELFGPTMRYDLDLVEAIPQEPSGKYRFCVSKIADRYLQELSV
jgi:phenylacetate-CoA ligase